MEFGNRHRYPLGLQIAFFSCDLLVEFVVDCAISYVNLPLITTLFVVPSFNLVDMLLLAC